MDFRTALKLAAIGTAAYLVLRLVWGAPTWGAIVGSWAMVSVCTSAITLSYQRAVVRAVCESIKEVGDGGS